MNKLFLLIISMSYSLSVCLSVSIAPMYSLHLFYNPWLYEGCVCGQKFDRKVIVSQNFHLSTIRAKTLTLIKRVQHLWTTQKACTKKYGFVFYMISFSDLSFFLPYRQKRISKSIVYTIFTEYMNSNWNCSLKYYFFYFRRFFFSLLRYFLSEWHKILFLIKSVQHLYRIQEG